MSYKIDAAVISAVHDERVFQNRKWGTIFEHPHEVGGYLTIMEGAMSEGKVREVQLTHGYLALVDESDYEAVSKYSWCASIKWGRGEDGKRFVIAVYGQAKVRNKPLSMHRFILGLTDRRVLVDHRNRNTLDNRRSNLRTCSFAGNSQNRSIPKTNRSGYKGVSWNKSSSNWTATIKRNGKQQFLGGFSDPVEAAAAYDAAALRYFGEFAALNKELRCQK